MGSWIIYVLYGFKNSFLRKRLIKLVIKLEGGTPHSTTLRKIFAFYHQIQVGMYTQGEWCIPNAIDKYTKIGRYCSIASRTRILNWDHPAEFKSTHSFFFDPNLGYVSDVEIQHVELDIGNDVWIGHGAIIMPGVTNIADGAIIGAGAVVSKNIPPYGIVVGNPGRVVRYRFSKEKIDELLREKWWEKNIEDIMLTRSEFTLPLEDTVDEIEL